MKFLNTIDNPEYANFWYNKNGEVKRVTFNSTTRDEMEYYGDELNWYVDVNDKEYVFCNEEEAVALYNALVKLHKAEEMTQEEVYDNAYKNVDWENFTCDDTEEYDEYDIEE